MIYLPLSYNNSELSKCRSNPVLNMVFEQSKYTGLLQQIGNTPNDKLYSKLISRDMIYLIVYSVV